MGGVSRYTIGTGSSVINNRCVPFEGLVTPQT